MVTVLGERGMLGSVVARRWLELGDTDHVINCIRPDDLKLTWRELPISPSTDAIAEDTEYAATKRELEEIPGLVVIRSGIVDITRQPDYAYPTWWCNPLTPLEWADLAYEKRDTPGVHIAGRERVTRYDIAMAVSAIFDRRTPFRYDIGYNYRVQRPDRIRPSLWDALIAYRDWLG